MAWYRRTGSRAGLVGFERPARATRDVSWSRITSNQMLHLSVNATGHE